MKSKLVSRNPILRFKLGKLILFALNGLGRWFYNGKEVFSDDGGKTFKLNESGRLTGAPGAVKNLVRADKVGKGAYKVGNSWYKIGGNGRPAVVTETPLKAVRLKNGSMIYKMRDGTWKNEKGQKLVNFASHLLAPGKKEVPAAGKPVEKNTLAATSPQSTVTLPPSLSTVLFTPGIINNGLFTPTGETTTLFNKTSLIPLFKPKPLETFGPGTFNTNVTYNSGNIRANRGVNYSNVNEYWDYLNNNRDSNDYKLFLNIMRTTDGNLNRDVFDLTMTKYGISGNLGRRDSGRLANLLNDLNLIGTEGSDARNSFIDSYNNHFNLALKETPVKQWAPQGQNWRSNLLNVLSLSYRKKGGTLSSRNPITRFKNGGVLKFLKAGNLPTAPKAEDRFKNGVRDSVAYLGVPGKDNSYFGESIKRVTTPSNAAILRQILFRNYPHDNDTIYTEVPEHTKRLPILPPVNIIPRKGFSFVQTPEYEILKRRFNTAWNLAK